MSPLTLLHQTLHHFCPNVRIQPFALQPLSSDTAPSANEAWAALDAENSGTWILRPAPYANAFLAPLDATQGWQEGDAELTPGEAAKLGVGVWSLAFVLVRAGVPSDTLSAYWAAFVREVHEIFGVLRRAFVEFEGPVEGAGELVRYWGLVAGERCFLRVGTREVDGEVAKRVVLLYAAFERELDLLRAAGEVLRFAGVSRWLEGMLLRRLARERTGVRRGAVREVESSETRGQEGEWWDVVHDMDVGEMIEDMRTCEQHGSQLGVSVHGSAEGTAQITIQGQHSVLDPGYLVTYVELVARSVHTAQILGDDELVQQLQSCEPNESSRGFANMLEVLTQGRQHIARMLQDELLAHSSSDPSTLPPFNPRESVDVFHPISSSLEADYLHSKAAMVEFMERYEKAGGYRPTTNKKLRAMLAAHDKV
ncbi:hypothetical protein G6514_000486 [Epicoccum nigrum]|nr:hypothetical protein G6514_000486 [Epicoccum nigrum]